MPPLQLIKKVMAPPFSSSKKSWPTPYSTGPPSGRNNERSLRSPDLTPRDFFLWATSKQRFTRHRQPQWRNQGLPGWASRPPGRPKWGRKWRKIEEKWEKLQENEEWLRKSSYLAHPGVRGWLRPWPTNLQDLRRRIQDAFRELRRDWRVQWRSMDAMYQPAIRCVTRNGQHVEERNGWWMENGSCWKHWKGWQENFSHTLHTMKHFCPKDIGARVKKSILSEIYFYELHLQIEFKKKKLVNTGFILPNYIGPKMEQLLHWQHWRKRF